MGGRVVLHSDLNNCYASIECMLHPELRGKYIAVCGSTEDRHGIVLAKNQLAKQCGVKTGEVIWEARQKCPQLTIVPPHMDHLLASTFEGREDSLRLERFYVAGNLDDFERLLNGPYQMEYYVTRNQIAAYEEQKIDEIYEYLTAHELLELPQAARSEYVLYRWNDTFANTENIRAMVERLKYQVECFNDALPYRTDQSYGDRAASQIRVIYRIT